MLFDHLLQPIRLGIQSVKLHKLRSLLTVLGVVFGVSSVVVMLAIGEGARREAVKAIQELGATNIILRSVRPTEMAANGETTGAVRYGLTKRDLDRLNALIPNLSAAPTREHRRRASCEDHTIEVRVVAATPAYQNLNQIGLRSGRFIEPLDVTASAPVAVLGSDVADTLFPLADPIGKFVRLGVDQYYEVIGVARPRSSSPGLGSNLPAQEYTRDVYIPFTTDQERFGENIVFDRAGSQPPEKVEITQITLSLKDPGDVAPTAKMVRAALAEYHTQGDTTITVPLDLLQKAEQTQRVFTWVLTAIASISLLVGGIGIMNIMLATVTERTREIGIRRSLGARRIDIIWQFMIEATVLACVGGLLGIALGIGSAALASRMAHITTVVVPWSPILAFAISLAVGLVFGIYPARRAAYLDPIQALRHE